MTTAVENARSAESAVTPTGVVCNFIEIGGPHRVVHYLVEDAVLRGAALPDMDVWVVDEGDEDRPYAAFFVLVPCESSWPSHYYPCWSGSEGVPLAELLAAALDEYAAKYVSVEGLREPTSPSFESQGKEAR